MDKKCHKTDEPLLLYPMTALNFFNADHQGSSLGDLLLYGLNFVSYAVCLSSIN